ncbi:hypothetical protein BpHYR1_000406 [Brachionus plicatilis]|uniref:Uncharacterized protein n=1 Tax=Brachionus plicatilis TaxID=10195 RepID=A0A3M7QQ37_BRAPC|nr:hypothetical protein BpHYR1_000406 [Brachionus plicatilis]
MIAIIYEKPDPKHLFHYLHRVHSSVPINDITEKIERDELKNGTFVNFILEKNEKFLWVSGEIKLNDYDMPYPLFIINVCLASANKSCCTDFIKDSYRKMEKFLGDEEKIKKTSLDNSATIEALLEFLSKVTHSRFQVMKLMTGPFFLLSTMGQRICCIQLRNIHLTLINLVLQFIEEYDIIAKKNEIYFPYIAYVYGKSKKHLIRIAGCLKVLEVAFKILSQIETIPDKKELFINSTKNLTKFIFQYEFSFRKKSVELLRMNINLGLIR